MKSQVYAVILEIFLKGGLEIPCKLTLRGELKVVRKLKVLLSSLPTKNKVRNEKMSLLVRKKKIE